MLRLYHLLIKNNRAHAKKYCAVRRRISLTSSASDAIIKCARVVELADSLDSGSSAHSGRAGSSPASRTISKNPAVLATAGFSFFIKGLRVFCCVDFLCIVQKKYAKLSPLKHRFYAKFYANNANN